MRVEQSRALGWLRRHNMWVFGAVVVLALIGVAESYYALISRERLLANRFADSAFWMASKFDCEIQAFALSAAIYDGSAAQLDDLRDKFDIVISRVKTIGGSDIEPRPSAALLDEFSRASASVAALDPRVSALQPGDVASARAIVTGMSGLLDDAAELASHSLQEDARYRESLAEAVSRAKIVFGIAVLALFAILLIALRAVRRQAKVLDIARQQLRQALDRAESGARAKSAFLATMSHEIRTPLNGILGAASLLAHTRLDGMQRRSVEIVKVSGQTLLAQLEDVLDFSALEADSVALHPEAFDLRELASATAHMAEMPASQKALDLVVSIDRSVPNLLIGDRRRIGQVLLNLVSNAVKFTPSGAIVVRATLREIRGQTWLRVAVGDTGPGVPFADRTRIFEEFTRLKRSVERNARGTGLGLAISRRIAAAMRGSLTVAGGPDGGSVFLFRVPVDIPPGAALPPPPPERGTAMILGASKLARRGLAHLLREHGYSIAGAPADSPALVLATASVPADALPAAAGRAIRFGAGSKLAGVLDMPALEAAIDGVIHAGNTPLPALPVSAAQRLLVADDDPINLEIAGNLLRHLGHSVTLVADGAEAIDALANSSFDCLLIDRHMPRLDGISVALAVRGMAPPLSSVRLVAVTADADAGTRRTLQNAGFDAVLTKPVTLERLADVLAPTAAAQAQLQQDGGDAVLDAAVRNELRQRLTPERYAALVKSFWQQALRTHAKLHATPAADCDRLLHSLAGSSASLGHAAVAKTAQECRALIRQAAQPDLWRAALGAALEAALRLDTEMLDEPSVGEIAAALAGRQYAGAKESVS